MTNENDNKPADPLNVDADQTSAGSSRRDFFKVAAAGAVVATAASQLVSDKASADSRGNSRSVLARSKNDKRRRILLKGGIVLSMDRAVGDFWKADVLVEGTKIKAVGPNLSASGAIVIDASNMIVMPGFVNTHHHQFQANIRSYYADAYYFASNLYPGTGYGASNARGGIFEKYTPEDAYLGEYMGAVASLSHGVTTVCDMSQVNITPAHTDACIAAIRKSGQRSVFAYSNGAGAAADGPNYAYPQDLRRLKTQYYSSTDQLMTLALNTGANAANYAMARELGVPIFGHVNNAATGMAVEPLLGPDCTYAHCMGLNDSTWRKFVDQNVKVSFCPVTEPTVANGIPPIMQIRQYGVAHNSSFSTDTETLISADFFTAMRGCYTIQRFITLQESNIGRLPTPIPMSCREVVEMATMGGAAGAHLADKVGSLTPGKEADIIMLRTDTINAWPISNVPGAIVTLMDTSNVDTVMVAGQIKKWDGELEDVDTKKLMRSLEASRAGLFARQGWQFDPFGTCCEYPPR